MKKETKQVIVYTVAWIILNLLVFSFINPAGTIVTNTIGFIGIILGVPKKIQL